MLECLKEERFTQAVETLEAIKLVEDAVAKLSEIESVLTTAAALVNGADDARILSFVLDLENLEIDLKKQAERMK